MQSEKDKAEQFVRSKLPELMELKFVSLPNSGDHNKYKRSIQLQNWLRVLEKGLAISDRPLKGGAKAYSEDTFYINCTSEKDGHLIQVKFNLTTGQPATEADYKALCEIFNI